MSVRIEEPIEGDSRPLSTPLPQEGEYAHLWQVADLDDLEVFRASYVSHTFARHAHETFSIGLIEAGASAYDARGTIHTATSGEVFVIHPDEVHTGYAATPTGWSYRVIYPRVELFTALMSDHPCLASGTPAFEQRVIADTHLRHLLQQLHTRLERPSGQLDQETYLTWVLHHLLSTYAQPTLPVCPVGNEPVAITWIRDYIEARFAEKISLDDLAALVHLHPVYLLRTFRDATGLPPHAYLNQVRIRHAKALLRAGVAPSAVAVDVGFADQSHLARHFRHQVGVSPSRYARGLG
ncbi:MAG: hypothetical protein QOH93_810 [Chloroflexia bacterium]|jgi:AraC-like DNA-binding protein|nr:hypothetical protein [Chloroflexia bacterium]